MYEYCVEIFYRVIFDVKLKFEKIFSFIGIDSL